MQVLGAVVLFFFGRGEIIVGVKGPRKAFPA